MSATSAVDTTKVTKAQAKAQAKQNKPSPLDQVTTIKGGKPVKNAKAQVEAKDPKLAPIINFLNGAVARSVPDNSKPANTIQNTEKKITFKDYIKLKESSSIKKKSGDLIIDLTKFNGLSEIKNAYSIAAQANAQAENEEEKITTEGITKAVYEPISRGYLSMASIKFVEKKKRAKKVKEDKKADKKEEDNEEAADEPIEDEAEGDIIVNDHLDRAIATLGLPIARDYSINDFIKAISDVVNDAKTFKIKAFNKTFPLAVHNTEKEAGHVNSRYVQHYLPFFDEVIQFVVENIDDPDVTFNTLEHVHQLITKEFISTHKSPDDLLLRIQVASFLERFKDDKQRLFTLLQSFVAHKKDVNDDINELTIKKEIKSWPLITQKKKGEFTVDNSTTLGKEGLDKQLVELLGELRKYFLFINIILDGKTYLESKSKSAVDYDEVLANYKALCAKQEKFAEAHEDIPNTLEGLLTFLVQSIVFISKFRSNSGDVTYITPSEFNTVGVIFKLNFKLAKKLKDLYTKSDKEIAAGVADLLEANREKQEFPDDLSAVGSITTFKDTAADNANIFAKIGNLVNTIPGVQINKNIRIAAGLAIIKYIVIETDRLLAQESSKKSPLVVYVKF